LPLAKVVNHRLGFEVSTPLPIARSYELAKFLLRLGLPFRVSPSCHRMRPDCPTSKLVHKHVARPSRGLIPFSVFPAARSYIHPTNSQSAGYVAPSGFRTLSTPCSPHDLSGLFHPEPALGVHPSRPSSSRNAVRRFRRRSPPEVPTGSEESARLSRGTARYEKPAHGNWGLARVPCRLPP
jgi:hypothetical protein